jgi:predicted secreted protein
VLHHYEIPMIITSAIILAIGWALYVYAQQLDCNEDSQICCHEPCAPKKDRTKMIMIFATVLFAVNVSVYFAFHWKSEQNSHGYEVHVEDQLGNHHNHNH